MPSDEPRVLVAVVTYNSADVLPPLLGSLEVGLAGLRWQLVVADNASVDDSVAMVRRLQPQALVVPMGRNAGYAAGINAAVAAGAEHDAVLVLNPDVRLQPGCGAALLEALRTPGTGIAVPLLHNGDGTRIDSLRREPSLPRALADALVGGRRAGRFAWLGEVVTSDRHYRQPALADWAQGSAQMISAACWRSCGPWDESFFLYSEETEYNLRARDAGFTTRFVPAARAVHLEGGSGSSPRLWPLVVVNRVRLYRRRRGTARGTLFWAVMVLREGSRAALGRATSRAAVRALVSPARMREPAGADWLR